MKSKVMVGGSVLLFMLTLGAAPGVAAPITYNLQIVQEESSITLDLALDMAGTVGQDVGISSVVGGGTAIIDGEVPSIRITALNASLADPIDLALEIFDAETSAWVAGLYLQSSAGSLALSMTTAGPAATLEDDGSFVQAGNTLSLVGTVYLDLQHADPGTQALLRQLIGNALGVTIPSVVDLAALGGLEFDADLPGILEDGPRITLPLEITGQTELVAGLVYLNYSVSGQVVMEYIPEPASILLCGAGFALMAGIRRRRRAPV
jgi:hypothetical protein